MLISLNMQAQNINRMENKHNLTLRQLSLAECACLEAQGDIVRLDGAIRMALDNGVTVNEQKEAFSQLYAYTGFPRSLNALNTLKAVLDSRKEVITNSIQRHIGHPVLLTIVGHRQADCM